MSRIYASRVQGEKLLSRLWMGRGAMTWHFADHAGRMYRCNCMPAFRIADRVCHPKAGAKRRGWMNHKP